ncbi:hypothetical protein DFJ58DRAFT_724559 [Suillus subalutaceus]|uniref:uncharacterized protein n=1 Tax=Suillus subalutaceus TaxID=48586 RepID=UPI001B87036B|nr:uncharacterized protein DFJ58DRAFT_724559 [Suillus subalutaceus]KAG1865005.1 hypothetical protein DFJ58DRAFT_724559 [Suillus subalutaceus]
MPTRLSQIQDCLVESGMYIGDAFYTSSQHFLTVRYIGDHSFHKSIAWCRMGKANQLVITPSTSASGPATDLLGPEIAVLSAVAQVSSNDYYLTADASYKGASYFWPDFATIKPSCTNERPNIESFNTDFDVVIENLKWVQDIITTDGFILKRGVFPPYTDEYCFKPLDSDDLATNNTEDEEHNSDSQTNKLDGIFLIENWPTVNDAAKGGLEGIKKTH